MTFSARAAKRRGLKISHCFSRKLRWILFERDETVANVILMTLNIRNYRFIAIFLRISTKWNMDKSIVRPPRKALSSWTGQTIELSAQLTDMKSHENTNLEEYKYLLVRRFLLWHCWTQSAVTRDIFAFGHSAFQSHQWQQDWRRIPWWNCRPQLQRVKGKKMRMQTHY